MPISQFQYLQMLSRNQKVAIPNSENAAEDESDLQSDVRLECESRGWVCLCGSMAHKTRRVLGELDFTIVTDEGCVVFVEAKAKRGKLSASQQAMIAWLMKLKANVVVGSSKEEIFNAIEEARATARKPKG